MEYRNLEKQKELDFSCLEFSNEISIKIERRHRIQLVQIFFF